MDKYLMIRVSEEQREKFKEFAKSKGYGSLSTYIRVFITDEIEKQEKK